MRTLKCKLSKRPTENNKMKYDNSSNLLQAKISSVKTNYESDIITALTNNNNSKVYKYISYRSLAKSHTFPLTLHHDSIVADSDIAKANILMIIFTLCLHRL